MIAGLVPPIAPAASVLGGADITALPAHARNMGLVFQNYALFPHLAVATQRRLRPGDARHAAAEAARERAGRALDLVRLGGLVAHAGRRAVRRPAAAGGAGARAGGRSRPCCCWTSRSPTSMPSCARTCATRSATSSAGSRITTLFVTHDQAEALTMSDRVVVLNAGRIEQIGTPAEIYDKPASRSSPASSAGRTDSLPLPTARILSAGAPGLRVAARVRCRAGARPRHECGRIACACRGHPFREKSMKCRRRSAAWCSPATSCTSARRRPARRRRNADPVADNSVRARRDRCRRTGPFPT